MFFDARLFTFCVGQPDLLHTTQGPLLSQDAEEFPQRLNVKNISNERMQKFSLINPMSSFMLSLLSSHRNVCDSTLKTPY